VIPTAVSLQGVSKSFGDVIALRDVSLDLETGGMLALLGPSGCGKTTCLRLIAGFERPDRGTIDIRGRRVASPTAMVPPERRRVGFVFQDLALFPHLTARENVAYGIRRDPDRRVRSDELLELVGLTADADRLPHQLSGGMQQRVALARALAPRPDVLLLDEPFSSLDQAMRTQLRAEVREILREARQSAIFVTHDQAEALTIADRVAVMTRGEVLQVAPPEVIYAEPETPYVATFVGIANLVSADVTDGVASTRFGPARLVGGRSRQLSGHALCLLRPEHFNIEEAPDGSATADAWQVVERRFSGSEILLGLRSGDGEQLWVQAGSRVRHLDIGDAARVALRDIETVAFGRRSGGGTPAASILADEATPSSREAAPTRMSHEPGRPTPRTD
jgi:iron(III) transport system ATP-binding protein